jgi:hypothetical protein
VEGEIAGGQKITLLRVIHAVIDCVSDSIAAEADMATSRSSLAFFLSVVMTVLLAPGNHASAYSIRTIYSFCRQGGSNCTDGGDPRGGLLKDASGNLYGVTVGGGANLGGGTIFELIPARHGVWKHKILHSFCAVAGCPDGANPDSGLIADISGNLYGTTPAGGKYDQGIAYELTPNATRTRWRLKVLHDFCPGGDPHCPDGAFIAAPLTYAGGASGALYDGTSALYGVAAFGGAAGWGIVFRIQPVTGKKIWSLKTLYNFCAQPSCADGASPLSGLLVDASGNLLGTTTSGQGSGNSGVVFELVPNAKKTKWSETVLHSFCSVGNCLDGAFPSSGIVMDASGDLFGGTSEGDPARRNAAALSVAAWSTRSCPTVPLPRKPCCTISAPLPIARTETGLRAICSSMRQAIFWARRLSAAATIRNAAAQGAARCFCRTRVIPFFTAFARSPIARTERSLWAT